MDRHAQLIAAGLVAVAVASGLWLGRGRSTSPLPVGIGESVASQTQPQGVESIVVHVSGWVERPGLVSLGEGARVADAVAAAGGARRGAQLSDLNLAERVIDGQRVVVPGPKADSGGGEAEVNDGRLRLNQASATELEALPGVGPVLAQRIVEHREERGPFVQVEDLLDVPGIGERKLDSLRDLLIVP